MHREELMKLGPTGTRAHGLPTRKWVFRGGGDGSTAKFRGAPRGHSPGPPPRARPPSGLTTGKEPTGQLPTPARSTLGRGVERGDRTRGRGRDPRGQTRRSWGAARSLCSPRSLCSRKETPFFSITENKPKARPRGLRPGAPCASGMCAAGWAVPEAPVLWPRRVSAGCPFASAQADAAGQAAASPQSAGR